MVSPFNATYGGKVTPAPGVGALHTTTSPLSAPSKDAREHQTRSANAWARLYRVRLRVTDTTLVILSVVLSSGIVAEGLRLPTHRVVVVDMGIATVWLFALALWKTRDSRIIGVGPGEYKRVIAASAGAFGWLAVVFLINQAQGMAVLFLVTMPVGTVAVLSGRWCWRSWLIHQRKYGHYLSKVIVLGNREDVKYVIDQIEKKSGALYQVVGVASEEYSVGTQLRVGRSQVEVVTDLVNITDAVARYNADAVIVAGQVNGGSSYLRELGWKLEESATELVVALSLTNVAGPRIQIRPVEGLPLMHVDLPQFAGYKHLLKRSVDLVGGLLAIILLSPLMLVLGLLIRRDSPGPIIFRQERVGRDGSSFEIYKFRSMSVDAEEKLHDLVDHNEGSGPLFKLHDDPRVTRVGRWLRRYSLDELPQFFNVVKGQMSLVGPRPPLPSEVAMYDGSTHRRLFIKPGVTGLWQVSGRSDLDWQESVRLDLYYVENWSLTGDLMIMWRTFKVMVRPDGAY